MRAEVVRGGARSAKEPVQLALRQRRRSERRAQRAPFETERSEELALLPECEEQVESGAAKQPSRPARSSRHPWAYLLRRVFSVDVETCSRCGGRMKLVEIANDWHDIARVLALHGFGPDPPREASPMPVGQMPLGFV